MQIKEWTRSRRLENYDYSNEGAYFITIRTADKKCYFGKVVDCLMQESEAGKIIRKHWQSLPNYYPCKLDEFIIMPNHFHGIIIIEYPLNVVLEKFNKNKFKQESKQSPFKQFMNCLNGESENCLNGESENCLNGESENCLNGESENCLNGESEQLMDGFGSFSGIGLSNGQENLIARNKWQKERRTMLLPKIIGRFKMNSAKEINELYKSSGKFWQKNYYEKIIRNEKSLRNIRGYIINNPFKWGKKD